MTDTRIPFVDGDFNFWERYDDGRWEPETKAVLERFLRSGELYQYVIDIGAWIGPVALWAAELGATVYAFEPDPIAFPQLIHNTQGKTVKAFQMAITAEGGPVRLGNPRFYGDSMSRLVSFESEGLIVSSMPAREIFHHCLMVTTPKLVKLDTEGGEIEILPTLAPLCAEYGIPMWVSWHEPWWPRFVTLLEIQSWFKDFHAMEGQIGGWNTTLHVPWRP